MARRVLLPALALLASLSVAAAAFTGRLFADTYDLSGGTNSFVAISPNSGDSKVIGPYPRSVDSTDGAYDEGTGLYALLLNDPDEQLRFDLMNATTGSSIGSTWCSLPSFANMEYDTLTNTFVGVVETDTVRKLPSSRLHCDLAV